RFQAQFPNSYLERRSLTHPLPRGGTDLFQCLRCWIQSVPPRGSGWVTIRVQKSRESVNECHASGELTYVPRTSRGLVSDVACECSSPVARRDCEMVEIACLKISCSCEPDSSRTENLSKLRIRPVSLAP